MEDCHIYPTAHREGTAIPRRHLSDGSMQLNVTHILVNRTVESNSPGGSVLRSLSTTSLCWGMCGEDEGREGNISGYRNRSRRHWMTAQERHLSQTLAIDQGPDTIIKTLGQHSLMSRYIRLAKRDVVVQGRLFRHEPRQSPGHTTLRDAVIHPQATPHGERRAHEKDASSNQAGKTSQEPQP